MATMEKAKEITDNLTIESLKDVIRTLEETKMNLLVTIKDLKEKLNQQMTDQADIYYFLNKKCDESFEVISSLEKQLSSEQADREIAEKLYEGRLEELRTSSSNNEARLQARITELEGKLEMVNSFAETKDETEKAMKALMTQLEEERKQFTLSADNMENRFLLEREKLRKSYDVKYDMLKKELEASVDGKLTKKTQRTQVVNVIMKKELDTQSRHAERLLEINETLLQREKTIARELELAKGLEQETMVQLRVARRKAEEAQQTASQHAAEMDALREMHAKAVEEKDQEIAKLMIQARKASERLQQSFHETDELWLFLKKSLRRYTSLRDEEEGVESRDVSALRPALSHLESSSHLIVLRLLQPHEDILVNISRYVKTGFDMQQYAKSGIHSWDKNKPQRVAVCSKAVQTDDEDDVAFSNRSAWLPALTSLSLTEQQHQQEIEGGSVDALSLPSLVGKRDAFSVVSAIDSIKSANHAVISAPPGRERGRRFPRRPIIMHPLDATLPKLPGNKKTMKKPYSAESPIELKDVLDGGQMAIAGHKVIAPPILAPFS
eukprot:gene927-1009_t